MRKAGLYLRSKGEKISIKIHPHYYRRNKKVVNGIIEIYNIDKLITEKPLNELMEEHDICYCNLDSVVKVMAELGKPCIPIVSNKYLLYGETDEGNVEVDMSEEKPRLLRIKKNSDYDIPYRLVIE